MNRSDAVQMIAGTLPLPPLSPPVEREGWGGAAVPGRTPRLTAARSPDALDLDPKPHLWRLSAVVEYPGEYEARVDRTHTAPALQTSRTRPMERSPV